MRGRREGMSPLRAGAIALVVIAVGTYLGFAKDIPFTRPFEVGAVFDSANSIRPGSPVRIAGVTVGKVKEVTAQEGTDAAVVTMQIEDRGLPLHADARAKIRPRIFLEGNFFVDLEPGTPSAPVLDDGDTIKITQTATPVQLDQVLTALQDTAREDLRTVLDELSAGLAEKPSAQQDRRADPSVRGLTGAEAFNDAYEDIAAAERSTAIVNEALLGTQPDRDVRRLLRGLADAMEGLGRNDVQLRQLIGNFRRTMGAFASEQGALRASIRELGPTLRNAHSALGALNSAFPSTRAFAREILPGVRETPATIEAGFPWIEQTRRLLSERELRGLARRLSPATRDLARFVDTSVPLFGQADLLARCVADVILPTGDIPIRDEFETGEPNYREFFYTLVGLSGETQNFDGNGQYVRFQPGGGSNTISIGDETTPGGPLFGNAFGNVSTRPRKPAKKPPYNDDVACHRNAIPDLNGPWAAKGSDAASRATVAAGTTASTARARRALQRAEQDALRARLRPFGTKTGADR